MIQHVVFTGAADGPLGVALDVVATAARLQRGRGTPLRQRVVSIDGAPVRSGTGRPIAVDGALSLRGLDRDDVLVVPGLSAATPAAIDALLRRPDVIAGAARLARAAARGATVAASCSASFVLAAAGLLDGREATTTGWLADELARRFPAVRVRADRMVVTDGAVWTAGAALAHADLVLALVARRCGPSVAHLVARYLVLDQRSSQARYMVLAHLRSDDAVVRAIEAHVLRHLDRRISLAELARTTGTSQRTLARRVQLAVGTSVQGLVQRVRMAEAAHLLDTSRASVEAIAAAVGYADPAAFRRMFHRHAGEAPRVRRARAAP